MNTINYDTNGSGGDVGVVVVMMTRTIFYEYDYDDDVRGIKRTTTSLS